MMPEGNDFLSFNWLYRCQTATSPTSPPQYTPHLPTCQQAFRPAGCLVWLNSNETYTSMLFLFVFCTVLTCGQTGSWQMSWRRHFWGSLPGCYQLDKHKQACYPQISIQPSKYMRPFNHQTVDKDPDMWNELTCLQYTACKFSLNEQDVFKVPHSSHCQ